MKPSNTASLRKTLGDIRGYAIDIYRAMSHNRSPSRAVAIAYAGAIVSKVDAALTVPVRDCDVGTPDEQAKRYAKFCNGHFTPSDIVGDCHKCPLEDKRKMGGRCSFYWAQMPYNGETK